MRLLLALLAAVLLTGCLSAPSGQSWRGQLTGPKHLVQAARQAAVTPTTWVPLVLAASTAISDWDEQSSEWAARKRPLFGNNASDASDTLRDLATGAYLVTALAAPSERWQDKVSGLGVGVGTMLLEGGLSEGLKSATSRQRPNGNGDRSFPSGHAGQAASRAALARRNLESFDLAPWQRRSLNFGLHGIAAGAAWARVEAEKHHLSDVLVGMALGNFLANFMHNVFMQGAFMQGAFTRRAALSSNVNAQLSYQAYGKGGALVLSVPLR